MRFSTLAIVAAAVLCACEPKSPSGGGPAVPATPFGEAFQIRFTWTPTVGAVEEAEFRTMMVAHSKVRANGKEQAVDVEQGFEFAFTEETLKVDGRVASEVRRKFSKAAISRSGKRETLGVQGKSLGGKSDQGSFVWTVDSGERLNDQDYGSMSEGLGRRGGSGGKDGCVVDEEFGSGKAVKVGDSWHPDAGTLAKLYADPGTEVDAAASRMTCTLKSAEKRGDAVYGAVDLDLDFSVVKSGGGVLNEPLHFILKGTVTGCLDGSLPDAALKAAITMKGTRTISRPGSNQSMEVDFNLLIELDSRRALRK
ncbi:MAG: hypothetical protein AAB074_16325 [Planctomycetota bacterium]